MSATTLAGDHARLVHALIAGDGDADWLAHGCAVHGLRLQAWDSLAALAAALARSAADGLILCTAALPPGQALAEVLAYLQRTAGRQLRVLCLAADDDLRLRLDARRGGCIGFHRLPLDDAALAEALSVFAPAADGGAPARVLVVDDAPLEAMISAQVLRGAGFEVQELNDELAIMDSIRGFQPDLILMDLNMPNATGAELTAIIRDHADLLLTPIVFLSGEEDALARREVLHLGADEFLTKPAQPDLLVATVRARIRRSRGIQRRYVPADETDPASGLLSRRAFLRLLERRLAAHGPAAGDGVLFLSIDDAERLVKTGGIGAEDLLPVRIGQVMRTALGAGDAAARFGRHSYTVLAARTAPDDLRRLAARIGHGMHDQPIQLGRHLQRVSLSIGLTRLADRADAVTHVSRAESACWKARHIGPGRIAEHGADGGIAHGAEVPAPGGEGPLAEALVDAIAGDTLELRYQPLLALSAQGSPARRYALEAWLPAAGRAAAKRLDPGAGPPLGELAALLDYRLMEHTLAVLDDQPRGRQAPVNRARLRLFVPQSMLTLRGRRWLLWMRDRLLECKGAAVGAIVVVLHADDVLAHLGVANALFPLLARLRLRVCLRAISSQPAALSLLADYPIAFAEPAASILDATRGHGELQRFIAVAHSHQASVVIEGVDDAATLARVCDSGADFAAGDFVQPASTCMDFEFTAALPG
jgi:PleD family two-component response regulator/EAL domain-containing protein (putative c-di-GMP-specific phosphodiesterase class I)